MTEPVTPSDPTTDPIIDEPLKIEAGDREVRLGIPDDGAIILTADAAEASGILLLDAALEARKRA